MTIRYSADYLELADGNLMRQYRVRSVAPDVKGIQYVASFSRQDWAEGYALDQARKNPLTVFQVMDAPPGAWATERFLFSFKTNPLPADQQTRILAISYINQARRAGNDADAAARKGDWALARTHITAAQREVDAAFNIIYREASRA